MASLADYLAAQNLTPTEFADRIGCDRASVSRYLNGQRFPTPEAIDLIIRETGGAVTADDLHATWRAARPARNALSDTERAQGGLPPAEAA